MYQLNPIRFSVRTQRRMINGLSFDAACRLARRCLGHGIAARVLAY